MLTLTSNRNSDPFLWKQQGAFSEKDEQLRQLLSKLDNMDQDALEVLSSEDLTAIRRQLSEGQTSARETVERLRQAHEENDMITRRRDELEARVTALELEYEELLGAVYNPYASVFLVYIFLFFFVFEQRKRYTRKRLTTST